MAAEVKARITVDAAKALQRIEDINKASGYTSASMSKMAKEIGAANAALSSLGAKMGGTGSGTAFKNISEQLEKQALAFSLVDSKSKAAANSATLYRNAIINLTKSGSLTKEQTDELVRTYNNYKTAAEAAKSSTEGFNSSLGGSTGKLLSVAKNILKFQLLMGPITAAIRGFKNTISDSVKVAGEAEQVFNKLSTVFANVSDSASRAASSIASLLGVSRSTAAGALSTVGDLLQAQGMGTAESLSTSSAWIKQFQDIIAFKDINMSLDEFAQNFMSGAAGNLRNFRSFGSIVKESAVNARLAAEGYDKLTGSELELAKMTTRANMALEQQANAIGATKREWDTMLSVTRRYSEAQKQFKEKLGQELNQFLKPMREALTDILETWNDLIDARERYNSGDYSKPVTYDPTSIADRNNLGQLLIENRVGTRRGNSLVYDLNNEIIAKISKVTGATIVQILDQFESMGNLSQTYNRDELLKEAADALQKIAEEEERRAKIEAFNAQTETLGSNFDNFLESLRLLPGSGTISAGELFNANSHMSFAQQLAEQVRVAGEQGFNNIKATDLSAFVSQVDIALGLVDDKGMIAAKADTIKNLYTILFNQFTKDKTLEKNADLLKQIADYYKEITTETVEMGNAWDETLKKLQQATMSSAGSLMRLQYQHGLTGTDAENARAMAYYDARAGRMNYQATLISQGMDVKTAASEAQKWYDIQIKIANENYNYAVETLRLEEKKRILLESEQANLKAIEDALAAIETHNNSRASYQMQLAMVGMSSADQTRYQLGLQSDAALEAGDIDLYKSIVEELKAFNRLQDAMEKYNTLLKSQEANLKAIEERQKAIDSHESSAGNYRLQLAMLGMPSADQTRYQLGLQANDALGAGDIDLYKAIVAEIRAFNELQTATENLKKEEEEAAKAAAELAAWRQLGNRALGSTGTLGGVVQSFQGDGDIWTKIFNAILTILENTENWGRIAEILDNLFAMFEPVTDAIINLITALPWDDIIFVLKVVASAVIIISGIAEEVIDIFKWLWDNIKTALKNVATDVYNLFHPFNKKEREQYKTWEELMKTLNDTAQKMVENTERVWAMEVDINNNLKKDDYAKQLALLKGLYDNGVLNQYEYAGSVAKVTGSSLGSVEKYDGATYATGGRGVTYFSGDIVINGYNRDPEDLAIEIERVLERRSRAGANLYG